MPSYFIKRTYYDLCNLNQNEHLAIWGTFYEDFTNNSIYTSSYYFLFFVRRFLLSLSFHFLYNYPAIQVIIVILSCWITSIYLIIFRPYKSRLNNIFQIVNESYISLGYTFTGLLYFKHIIDSKIISWIVLSFIYLSYLMHLIISLTTLLRIILKWIRSILTTNKKPDTGISHNQIKIEVE